MKTNWSINYLNKKYSPRELSEWKSAKRKEYEQRYGVDFSGYTAHGKWVILPVLNFQSAEYTFIPMTEYGNYLAETIRDLIETHSQITFAKIHNKTGISIDEVMGVCAYLVKNRFYGVDVDRNGKCVVISKFRY